MGQITCDDANKIINFAQNIPFSDNGSYHIGILNHYLT